MSACLSCLPHVAVSAGLHHSAAGGEGYQAPVSVAQMMVAAQAELLGLRPQLQPAVWPGQ